MIRYLYLRHRVLAERRWLEVLRAEGWHEDDLIAIRRHEQELTCQLMMVRPPDRADVVATVGALLSLAALVALGLLGWLPGIPS